MQVMLCANHCDLNYPSLLVGQGNVLSLPFEQCKITKPNLKRRNDGSAAFRVVAPRGSRACRLPFAKFLKRSVKIRSARACSRLPLRAAKAFEFLTNGYRQDLDAIVNQAIFTSDASEIILVKDIELYSMCEHHLLPFIGKAHVAYIPNGKVIGSFESCAHRRCLRAAVADPGTTDDADR